MSSRALVLVGLGFAVVGASCALPFWSLPIEQGAGGATGSTTAASVASGQGGATPECTQPGAPMCGGDTEQCNDGGVFKLDGCNESCGYEVVQRISSFAISIDDAPSFCVAGHNKNQFGHAINPSLVQVINQPAADQLKNGSLNILTHFHCLSDLSGTNASDFTIGVLDGFLDSRGLWPTGPAPEDWPFLADAAAISAGTEKYQLAPATITSHVLLAGPSSMKINFPLAGAAGELQLDNAVIRGTVSTATSHPAPPPMNIAQDLVVFDSVAANGPEQGLCGDITAQSLAQIAVAPQIAMGGTTPCTQGYTPCAGTVVGPGCNSLLDVFVSGCSISTVKAVQATQPDVPGNGSQVTTLTAGGDHKVTVPPGDKDAYSSYFLLTMVREHIAGESCAMMADCQSGQTCNASVCTPR